MVAVGKYNIRKFLLSCESGFYFSTSLMVVLLSFPSTLKLC